MHAFLTQSLSSCKLKITLDEICNVTPSYLRYLSQDTVWNAKSKFAFNLFYPPLLYHVLCSCLSLNRFHLIWFARSTFPFT